MECTDTTTTTEAAEAMESAAEAPAAESVEQKPEAGAAPAADPADSEPLGEAGQRALDREREQRKRAEREAREAREEAQTLRLAAARREVAQSRRLTDDQAALIVGESADEMAAHADQLLAAFAPPEPPAVRRRPLEALRSGVLGLEAAPPSTAQLADEVLAG